MLKKLHLVLLIIGFSIVSFGMNQEVLAAKYYYSKYNSNLVQTYADVAPWETGYFPNTTYVGRAKGYSFDVATNKYVLSANVWKADEIVNAGDVAYWLLSDVNSLYRHVAYYGGFPASEVVNADVRYKIETKNTSTSSYIRGSLIQSNITAEDGTYPVNGRHTDGYWYVRGSLANTTPTTPILTMPSTDFVSGSQQTISWNGTDADGDTLTYTVEASYNNGTSWTTLYSGANKTYTYTVPTNQTQVSFRVRSYDGTAYSAHATSANITIRKAMYSWTKYNTVSNYSKTYSLSWSSPYIIESSVASGYQSYTFSSTTGVFSTAGGVGDIIYNGTGSLYTKVGTTPVRYSAGGGIYRSDGTITSVDSFSHYSRGSLIQSGIIAEEGTYPLNSRHTDGYWYVRGGLVSATPETPTLTVPTVQFEHGDVHLITWNSSNVEAVTYTFETSYNSGTSWVSLYNGTNKNYTYTVPSNQTQVLFRVKASNGSSESAYAVSEIKTIREVMYSWSKYNVANNTRYTQSGFPSTGTVPSSHTSAYYSSTGYRSYSFNSSDGTFNGSSATINPLQQYVNSNMSGNYYLMSSDSRYMISLNVISNSSSEHGWIHNFTYIYYESSPTSFQSRGTLIQSNIQAGYNAYLHDQRNSDGFWWVRGQRVLAADTTPPIIELTEQTAYSATSVVTVKTYDTSAVAVTKWAAGNQPANFFTTGGTNVSGGQFTATQNGTYTVYARDANGNVAVQTINVTKIDVINPIFISTSVENATYVQGNKYWMKPGDQVNIRLRGKDLESGLERLYYYVGVGNGDLSRSFYHFGTNKAELLMPTEGWQNIEFVDIVSTYDDGIEKEALLSIQAKQTTSILSYRYHYYVRDVAQNQIGSIDSGLDIQIDGEKPTGIVTQDSTTFTKNNVLLTATASDGIGSGIKRMRLPHGSYVPYSSFSYSATTNGTYTFEFEDQVGNVGTTTYTVTNIDKTAPTIHFTPEMREADFKDIEVQTNIADVGVSGYKQARYVWTKDTTYPTEGWSEWDNTLNPLITQDKGGKWYLHTEAMDHAGNIGYARGGIYEKIVVSGGPSVNINVFPVPTGTWVNQPINVYVMDSGDTELLAKATKQYEVTNSPLYPTTFNKAIPSDKKTQLNLQGENFIHIQYTLEDGTKISATSGPYLIDTGTVGDFELKLINTAGVEVTNWTNQNLRLVIGNPTTSSVSGFEKQYRIEGLHQDWQTYQEGMTIATEGDHRIFGRIVSGTGTSSVQKTAVAKIDQTKPVISSLRLIKTTKNQYDVFAKADDPFSGVKEVKLNSGTPLEEATNGFELRGLTAKPTSVTIQDLAGNSLSAVSFAAEPTITFDAPYTLTTPLHRSDAVAKLTNATGYLLGNRGYSCSGNPCGVTITHNTTLTAVQTEGVKETRTSVTIQNIDQSELRLILTGKRSNTAPKELTFSWNYALTSGTLTCTEDGQTKAYAVSGNQLTFNGSNYTYNCSLSGIYKGVSLHSNSVSVYPDGSIPVDGTGSVAGSRVTTNVYHQKTMLGKGYLINGKSHNYKQNSLPIPQNEITAN